MHWIVNAEKPRVGFRFLYLVALGAWFLLTLIGIGYVVRDSFATVERSFRRYAEAATAELRDKLKANEAVLAGFGSFLSAVAANDRPGVQRYAEFMLAAYSHIYRLEVVREVDRQDRENFELHFRVNGDDQFTIRTFSYDGARNWSIVPDKPLYQPIVFVWPEFGSVAPVVGLDMDSVPHLREPLLEARAREVAISSRPFKLIQGDLAYVMFRHVDRGESRAWGRREYVFDGPLTALLVMRAAALLPALPAPMTAHRLQITRYGEAIEPPLYDVAPERPPSEIERLLFPALRLLTNDYSTSQPMQLTLERQIRFRDLNLAGVAAVTSLSLLTLGLLVAYLYGHNRNVATALSLERQAAFLALHDPLTNLPNRHLLEDRVDQALANWRRRRLPFALLFLDLDRFKEINDRHGHAAGDQLLCSAAKRLAGAVRESDTVARYGGDEFIVLISAVTRDEDVDTVRNNILEVMGMPFEVDGELLRVCASLGVGRCPQDGEDFRTLLKHADAEMYGAKSGGRAESRGAWRQVPWRSE